MQVITEKKRKEDLATLVKDEQQILEKEKITREKPPTWYHMHPYSYAHHVSTSRTAYTPLLFPALLFDWLIILTLTIFDNIILEKSAGSISGVYVDFYCEYPTRVEVALWSCREGSRAN